MTGARAYAVVTASYWSFTLTDGALRMLVLLHFHRLGYSPFALAFLFVLYEAAGIAANLGGGWLAVRFGIARMLTLGLGLQVAGLLMLSALGDAWSAAFSVVWVALAQALSGVAKDITKTASKSAVKLVAADGGGRLFRWTAWFTGSKNAMKGAGFFAGGALLEAVGFQASLWLMAALVGAVLVAAGPALPSRLGRAGASRSVGEFLSKSAGVNTLAAARVFLFGARDVWFVVGLPVFLYTAGWSFREVGAFLALWTVGYGAVQAAAPSLVRRSGSGLAREVPAARLWGVLLAAVAAAILAALAMPEALPLAPDAVAACGLAAFGVAFAVNSSLHSYLILAYAGSGKAAEDVGFYYAANAAGRLAGTLLSGLLYQSGGLAACLAGSTAMLAASAALAFLLPMTPHAAGAEVGARGSG